jgi:type II secretory pathway pseudopilin PulG
MTHKPDPQPQNGQKGFILPGVLAFILAMTIIGGAVLTVILNNFFVVGNNVKSQQAFNIAEAGINYYLWHMAHSGTDYKDGQSTPTTPDPTLGYGPYVHHYIDSDAKDEGTFTLWIKPQGGGSTIATVRSIGQVAGNDATRTLQAQIGASSFAAYGVVSDSALWFGADESADGPVFSNQGVEMDGSSDSTVSSANATYVPPNGLHSSNYPNGQSHPGVWCDTAVTSPVNCNTRDKSNWLYPATQIDFNQVSTSLCTMKKVALADDSATASIATQSNACTQTPTTRTNAYLPQRSASGNDSRGYFIQLNNNKTYDLYNVNNVKDNQSGGYANALTMQLVATGISLPPSGVIFAEDNVWVRSGTGGFPGRVTIGAGRLATSYTANLTVVDNLAYTAKDGTAAIGLVGEGSVFIAPFAAPATGSFTLEVDAAVLAETGSVEYYPNYTFSNQQCTRGWVNSNQQLHFYGSVATRQTWTWSWQWGSSCGDNVADPSAPGTYISGFKYNTTQYDYNLLYAPPPSYPVINGYNILSWREVLTKP